MSLLTIIQRTCRRVGLTAPSSAIGNTDDNIIRLIELANEEGEELALRADWQALISEATHTSLAQESQGAMTTIAGASFDRIVPESIWNRSSNRPWVPVTAKQWQHMKSSGITGPDVYFRIRGGNLITLPSPTAGHTIAFEWVSKNWCQSSVGTGQSAWAADTDTGKLDEAITIMGLVWRWKKSQGLEYAEDFRQYETRVANAMTRDGVTPRLNMGGGSSGRLIDNSAVSEGSWSL